MAKQRIAIIYNGLKNGLKSDLLEFQKAHSEALIQLMETQYIGHGIELAFKAAQNQFDVIIAAGGDGTINEVINGMVSSDIRNSKLAIYPAGTANDFASDQGIDPDLNQLWTSIHNGNCTHIDIGKLESKIKDDLKHTRYFINIADAGLGGHVVDKLNNDTSTKNGKLKYFKAVFNGFLSFKKPRVKIFGDLFEYDGKLLTIAICNGRRFGHGMYINPDARINDGIFNITLIGNVKVFDYLKNLGNLKKARLIKHPQITYHQSRKIFIDAIEGECSFEVDGEAAGSTPAEISILPAAIQLITPTE